MQVAGNESDFTQNNPPGTARAGARQLYHCCGLGDVKENANARKPLTNSRPSSRITAIMNATTFRFYAFYYYGNTPPVAVGGV